MVQRCGGASFPQKARQRLFVLGGVGGEKLQRYFPAKRGVLGAVNFPHATRTEPFQNTIMRDRLPDQACDPNVETAILLPFLRPSQCELVAVQFAVAALYEPRRC